MFKRPLRLHVHRKSTWRWPTRDVGRTTFSTLVYMFTIREVGHMILPERYGGAILENAELSRRLIVFVDALGRWLGNLRSYCKHRYGRCSEKGT